MSDNNKETLKAYGKVVKLPKNGNPNSFMDEIKIPKNKYFYFIMEKSVVDGEQIHLIKWNSEGVDSINFCEQVKRHYINSTEDEKLKHMFYNMRVVGNSKFTIIDQIPNIEVIDVVQENGKSVEIKKSLVSKIQSDLIKLLRD